MLLPHGANYVCCMHGPKQTLLIILSRILKTSPLVPRLLFRCIWCSDPCDEACRPVSGREPEIAKRQANHVMCPKNQVLVLHTLGGADAFKSVSSLFLCFMRMTVLHASWGRQRFRRPGGTDSYRFGKPDRRQGIDSGFCWLHSWPLGVAKMSAGCGGCVPRPVVETCGIWCSKLRTGRNCDLGRRGCWVRTATLFWGSVVGIKMATKNALETQNMVSP